jgi:hypothetical protein
MSSQLVIRAPPQQKQAAALQQLDQASSSAMPDDSTAGSTASPAPGSIECVELAWGEEGFSRSPLSVATQQPFDYIIACELVYNTRFHDDLLWSMRKLSNSKSVSQHRRVW